MKRKKKRERYRVKEKKIERYRRREKKREGEYSGKIYDIASFHFILSI